MIAWMRTVLPSGWALGTFVFFYLLFDAPFYLLTLFQPSLLALPRQWHSESVLKFACAAYGVYRVAAFHPVFRPDYFKWLKAGPWNSSKPLPAGPIHLVWQDLVVCLIVEFLALRYPWTHPAVPLLCLLVFYLLCLSAALFATGQRAAAYLIAFGMGGVVHLHSRSWMAFAGGVALYLLAYGALRRSLARFPWPIEKIEVFRQKLVSQEMTRQQQFGWPFNRLSPRSEFPSISWGHGLLLSLLAGWWCFVLMRLIGETDAGVFIMFYVLPAMFGIGARAIIYLTGHWPPISFWGRIWTLRWIIPKYDQALVAPVLAILTCVFAPGLLRRLGLPDEASYAVSLACVLFIIFNVGPTLRSWRLTGSCRLTSGLLLMRQEYTEV